MHKVTVVCTLHSEVGRCTSDELFNILMSIEPEIIFEEQTSYTFDLCYKAQQLPFVLPEVRAVKRYLMTHQVPHFPVDSETRHIISYESIDHLFKAFGRYESFASVEEKRRKKAHEEGYAFLNSVENEKLYHQQRAVEKMLIENELKDSLYPAIYKAFSEVNDRREIEMIRRVIEISAERTYGQGVMLVGAGHRMTLFEKINEVEQTIGTNIKWTKFGS